MNRRTSLKVLVASLVLIAAALIGAGCAYPTVELQTARLDSVKLSGLTVDVFLNVENPNQFDLPIEGVDWNLQVFDVRVGSGTSRMDRTLPAQKTTRVKMPISVTFNSVERVATRLGTARSIPWDLDGTAHFRAPTGPLALDFADGGKWENPLGGSLRR